MLMMYSNCDNCIHNDGCDKKDTLENMARDAKNIADTYATATYLSIDISCEHHKI